MSWGAQPSLRRHCEGEKLPILYPPFQEVVSKRPKKIGAPEDDDGGVEVYYREGEDELEEPRLPPGVRLTAVEGGCRRSSLSSQS